MNGNSTITIIFLESKKVGAYLILLGRTSLLLLFRDDVNDVAMAKEEC